MREWITLGILRGIIAPLPTLFFESETDKELDRSHPVPQRAKGAVTRPLFLTTLHTPIPTLPSTPSPHPQELPRMELLAQQGAGLSEPNPSSKTLHYFPFASLILTPRLRHPLLTQQAAVRAIKAWGGSCFISRCVLYRTTGPYIRWRDLMIFLLTFGLYRSVSVSQQNAQ